jgi:threonine/homoserine/homoserine lactone efflux protein
MFDPLAFVVFLMTATVLAITPGPALLFVAARTLAEGRAAGIATSLGTAVGGLAQVAAAAAGFSGLMLASAEAFTVVKLLGALYLVWLGIAMFRAAGDDITSDLDSGHRGQSFRDGAIVELLNPKMAAFLLAFIPQFVDPARGDATQQFVVLGAISVVLNSTADIVVACLAARVRQGLETRRQLVTRIRAGSALIMIGLGLALALAKRPTS